MGSQRLAPVPCGAPDLPVEVVEQIFRSFATTLSTRTDGLRQFPWFLGHIRSSWRYVFLSMRTEFWDSIKILLGSVVHKHTKSILQFFLERDSTASFSLNVEVTDTLAKLHSPAADAILHTLEMLINESMRWKVVSLSARPQYLLPLLGAKNRIPLLQEFRLGIFGCRSEKIPDQVYDVFETAPSLDSIDMPNLTGWKFNWSKLKVVNVRRSTLCAATVAISQMMKLERLRLNFTLESGADPCGVILLPKLTALYCDPVLLRFLEVPALEELMISSLHLDSSDAILSFLHRSSCGSNILRLGIKNSKAATVIEILKHMPHILELQLAFVTDL